jgi:hypothetical protein
MEARQVVLALNIILRNEVTKNLEPYNIIRDPSCSVF